MGLLCLFLRYSGENEDPTYASSGASFPQDELSDQISEAVSQRAFVTAENIAGGAISSRSIIVLRARKKALLSARLTHHVIVHVLSLEGRGGPGAVERHRQQLLEIDLADRATADIRCPEDVETRLLLSGVGDQHHDVP